MLIRYFAQISDWTGCAEEILPLAALAGTAGAAGNIVTTRQALAFLAEKHGSLFRERIYDPATDNRQEDVFILLNGCHLARLQGLDTPVAEADVLAVIPVAEAG